MSFIEWMYKRHIRPRIFARSLEDAEVAHELGLRALKFIQSQRALCAIARAALVYKHPMLRSNVCGLDFPNPFGLAAGFDKYCEVYWGAIPACGWGSVEIGGITAYSQPGNERPRIKRSEHYEALWNNMGFNNPGECLASRALQRNPKPLIPLGLNVGKSKITPLEKAAEDYCQTVKQLWPFIDYITINPSSPNTPGLRELQNKDNLRDLILAVKATNTAMYGKFLRSLSVRPRPLGIKIAPDLSDEQLADIVQVCRETETDFIVAVNTTVSREGLDGWNIPTGRGGISGKPLGDKSAKILRALYKALQGEIALISVGGISGWYDLYERIVSGANLCQAYSAWVFEGPDFTKRSLKGLVTKLKQEGFKNVSQAVGFGA